MRENFPTPEHIQEAYQINERIDAIKILNEKFRARTKHELSKDMPVNSPADRNIKTYSDILPGYRANLPFVNVLQGYKPITPIEGIRDFKESADIGWKIHLNVPSASVKFVSDYLNRAGYTHKYLSGGLPSKGKIFTIYIGSHDLTARVAKKISTEIGLDLLKPREDTIEIEFARGVVGRFVADQYKYAAYGSSGFQWLHVDEEKNEKELKVNPDKRRRQLIIQTMEERAFMELNKTYGEYFRGKI